MRIGEIFRQDIGRRIEEVVKIDLADDEIVAGEISEYVVTERIQDSLRMVVEAYQETILNPSGLTNLWISGFFGSGKSSFAKVLGYLLENRVVAGHTVADWFFTRCDDLALRALLNTSWARAPACAVLLDLASSHNVLSEAENIVAPLYRALLARLDYAQTPKLAALEYDLETEGKLEAFEAAFAQAAGRAWRARRDSMLAVNQASEALHRLDPATFPAPDSWARSFEASTLTANWFANRAVELLKHRGGGARRIVFVVDEAGQYVSRSISRILQMQGLAEAFQKHKGRLWLLATGQERLEEVVEGLESRQVEVQRLRDRFPLRVDLLPSDIHEVVGRRVLDKNDNGRRAIGETLRPHRQKLAANTRLMSEARAVDSGEDELVRFYPLMPYQVQLLIDSVSTRRSHVPAGPPMGGSSRTIIKHAQQLITSARVGLKDLEVGALVTLDRSYDLLEEVIPTSWRAEVEQVADRYGEASVEVATIKAVALAHDVRSLNLTAHNLAVLLHPHVAGESRREEVAAALAHLVADDRLRETERGYQLQSVEQKQWEQERRNIDLRPGDEIRVRKKLLAEALNGLTVTEGRSFSIGVAVHSDQRIDGDVTIELAAVEDADTSANLRALSRESAHATRVFWLFTQEEDTWTALRELHRCDRMIERRNVASKSPADGQLLFDERNRRAREERDALERLSRDLAAGEVLFRGESQGVPPGGDLKATAQAIMRDRLVDIYPRLDRFAAAIDPKDVLLVLRAEDLGSLPESLGEGGIGLTRVTPEGVELAAEDDPLAAYIAEVGRRHDYGQAATGQALERHFGKPPFGAPVAVVQALTAAALRAGLVEVVYQGQPIGSATDRRLDNVFRTLPSFRQIEVRPPQDRGPDGGVRGRLAGKLQEYTGESQSPALVELARTVRSAFGRHAEPAVEVAATLTGAGLAVPAPVARFKELLARLRSDDDAEVVESAVGSWEDLVGGVKLVEALASKLREDPSFLMRAREEARAQEPGLPDAALRARSHLCDLLAAADYVTHAGEIRALTETVASARRRIEDGLRAELTDQLDRVRLELEGRFAAVDPDRRAEALRPLAGLAPAGDASIDQLRGRLARVDAEAQNARRLLEELASERGLVEIRVADLAGRPLTTPADLSRLVEALREAVERAWADGKEVRLA